MLVKPWSQGWLMSAGAYPGFCSLKRLEVFLLIIQLCFLEYKYRAKRVQMTDICTRPIPPGHVKFQTLASQNFGKRNRWIINLLLDVLVCSIAVYFYSFFCILTRPTGSSKYCTTRKNI